MPRNARCVQPGLPYHITQRGTDCRTTFHSRQDRLVYLDLLRFNLPDSGVRVLSYCLMTNHVHLVAIPNHSDSLAVLFRRVHGRYAQYLKVSPVDRPAVCRVESRPRVAGCSARRI